MIALVRTTSGVQERIHAGNQEATLVHGYRERSGEDGTGLSVFKRTVADSRESCAEKLCVTWQACPMKQRMIFAASAMTAPDEMIKSWAITLSPIYTGASLLLFTVPFSKRVQFSMVSVLAYVYITDCPGIDYLYVLSDRPVVGGDAFGIICNHFL